MRGPSIFALAALTLSSAPVVARPVACTPTLLRAMTYNIRLDTPVDGQDGWAHRRPWLTAQIAWLHPDIFGLQEVVINQKRDIAVDLPDYHILGRGRDDGRDAGESSPIGFERSRLRMEEGGTFWLSTTPERPSKGWDAAFPRVVTWARLTIISGRARLLVLNTHWDHVGEEARRQSGIEISRWLATHRRPNEQIVLLGDFNTDLPSAAMQPLVGPGATPVALRDSRGASQTTPFGPVGTFNGFHLQPNNAPTIDHILVGSGIVVRRYAVIAQNIDGHLPSDHYPVFADLALPDTCATRR